MTIRLREIASIAATATFFAALGCPAFQRGGVPLVDGAVDSAGDTPVTDAPLETNDAGAELGVSPPTDVPAGDAKPGVDVMQALVVGARCTSGAQCANRTCVDGYCCNRACGAPCEACDLPGSAGTCSQVTTGQPHNKPECAGSGVCKGYCAAGTTQCTFPAANTCGAPSCAGTTLTKAGACDGAGACKAGLTESCAPFLCVGDRCLASCSMRDDCALNHFCDVASGACISRVRQVTAGAFHTCALLDDKSMWCWGKNDDRQLGVDTGGLPATKPVELRALRGQLEAISAGNRFTCALLTGGKVSCWGGSTLGTNEGPETKRFDARPVLTISRVELTGAQSICTGFDHACAVRDDGVWCWGSNLAGQLGTGDPSPIPVAVHSLKERDVTSVHCGVGSTVAVKRGEGVVFWGLGSMDAVDRSVPERIADRALYGVGTGDRLSCYLNSANTVHCATDKSVPYRMWRAMFDNVREFAVSSSGAAASVFSGELYYWRVGAGGTAVQHNVSNLTGLSSHGFGDHYCAITSQGSVVCWGANYHGQLGNGTTGDDADRPPGAVRWR